MSSDFDDFKHHGATDAEAFAAEHGVVAMLDHMGLIAQANEVGNLYGLLRALLPFLEQERAAWVERDEESSGYAYVGDTRWDPYIGRIRHALRPSPPPQDEP